MKRIIALFFMAAFLSACLGGGAQQQAPVSWVNDSRECARNFTYDGSFLAGRTYRTQATVANVTVEQAVTRSVKQLMADGWQTVTVDPKMGIVTVNQTVSYGQGKTVPLNVSVDQIERNKVKLSFSYSTPGGVTSPLEAIVEQFCTVVSAVQN